MNIKFKLSRSDEWLKATAIRTGENAPREVYVNVDSVALGETRRAVLVECFRHIPSEVDDLTYNKEYQWSHNRYNTYGRFYLYSVADIPSVQDVLVEIDNCILILEEKRKAHLEEEAERKAREEQERKEKEHQESLLRHARTLLKDELEKLADLKKYRTILSDVLSELTPHELQSATDKTGWDSSQVEEACEYSLNWE